MLWRSKMQKTVSPSTAEEEYYAASEMRIEVLYLSNLLRNMGFPQEHGTPVYEGTEWGYHIIGGRERAKHIDTRKHFAHEVVQNREMRKSKVDTSQQIADVFTVESPSPCTIRDSRRASKR